MTIYITSDRLTRWVTQMSPELTKAMRSGLCGHMVAFRRAPGVLVYTGEKIRDNMSDKYYIFQAHLNLIREERPRVPRGGVRAEEQRAA